MDARKLLVALALGSLAMPASAQLTEIFKCRDAQGHWTYTNDRRQAEKEKCELVASQINVTPAQKAARPASSPSSFPRESSAERAAGKGRQREILQQELASEEAALTKAQQALAEQESVRSGNERNYARVEERLKPYKDSVESHQKNIEALRREIANQNR
jgi:septal ring factor EnvC (AmiA/AmiB activator)